LVVVDASATVELLLGTELGAAVGHELRGEAVAVPAHADAEVLSAVGRLVRARSVTPASARSALAALSVARYERYPVHLLLEESWELRANVALQDALYVVLARRLGASLITTDAPLSRVKGVGVPILLVQR
jgi:predicted nucleic acid-binding protein